MYTSTTTSLLLTTLLTATTVYAKGRQIVNHLKNPVFHGRLDPIVSPGIVSNHEHLVFGGGAFQADMSDPNTAVNAKCTANQMKKDLSNYWMPSLMFNAENGSVFAVPTTNFHQVYYAFEDTADPIKPFPLGLHMIAGNAMQRGATAMDNHNYNPGNGPVYPYDIQCVGSSSVFTDEACTDYGGLRINIFFPQCYDTSQPLTAYQNNTKYATSEGQAAGQKSCSVYGPTWIYMPQLNFEVYFDVHKFDNDWTPGKGHVPWAFANGDPTGAGAHGDFYGGWEQDFLQDMINTCDSDPATAGNSGMDYCYPDEVVTDAEGAACTIASPVDEPVWGELPHLPGCVPISATNPATIHTDCNYKWPTTFSSPTTQFTDFTSSGWEYYGCFTDAYQGNVLPGIENVATIDECMAACPDNTYVALEYGSECKCGNDFTPSNGNGNPSALCSWQCPGNNKQICGGPNLISVYKKCDASGCVNQSGPVADGQGSVKFAGASGSVGSGTSSSSGGDQAAVVASSNSASGSGSSSLATGSAVQSQTTMLTSTSMTTSSAIVARATSSSVAAAAPLSSASSLPRAAAHRAHRMGHQARRWLAGES